MKRFQNILSSLPHSPGVYQYFSASGDIIYVGKSKNLKSRVSSYFSGVQKLNFAKRKMLKQIKDIKYIVTNNETESLILENDLIKKHQPKYNILLKDDKNFLYIKITNSEYPQIIKTRISPDKRKKDGKYFGPYVSSFYVTEILKILKTIFWYGVGSHNFFRKKWSYSLDTYIFEGKTNISEEDQKVLYIERITQIEEVLKGNTHDIKTQLKQEMKAFAHKQMFELAQKRKKSVEAIESLENTQIVRDGVQGNYYVLQILEKYEKNYLWMLQIQDGKIIATQNFEVQNLLWITKEEMLTDIIEKKWLENTSYSFITPINISSPIEEIKTELPKLWAKFELLKLCYKNIYEYAHKKHIDSLSTKAFSKKTMVNLLDILWYSPINSDIIFECNDISHLSWTHTVASRSIIENGKTNKQKYKRLRIKSLSEGKIDDFGSMREVISRRLLELEKIKNYPDLIIIDGWKGQLWAVMEIVKEKNIKLQIVSIAKREEELFIPWKTSPILLDKNSQELRLVQAIRDEAHRFAITFNRDSRIKSQKKNILESIPGIWPATRKKILKLFWSVENLQYTNIETLETQLGKKLVESLSNHWII